MTFDFPKLSNLLDRIVAGISGLYVRLRYFRVIPELRYFYKETYYCQYVQLRYFIKDYITKPSYKKITWSGEFGAELLFALPFAYWHYKNGTLKITQSAKLTKELYFFSQDHVETFDTRDNEGNHNHGLPRVLYSHDYKMSKWLPVPLKEIYQNDVYKFEKPILIIANRYNTEWGAPPVSFLDIPTLSFIISKLKADYTIIYNRPRSKYIINDHSEVYDLKEFEWLATHHPEVLLMDDLYNENKIGANNFNHFQLMVYANADHFISTHGGTATLASYFRGINIIFSKKGPEYHFGCYQKLFPKLSGALILPAQTEEELKNLVEKYYVHSNQQE